MRTENWKQVPEFPGYEVSDQGRIRSYWVRSSASRMSVTPQRILKGTGATRDKRYLIVCLRKDGKGHTRYVHDLVLLAFVGPKPDGLEACHYDDDKSNNVLSNLRYDTRKANAADAVRNGKIRKAQATEPGTVTVQDATNMLNISRRAVSQAISRGKLDATKINGAWIIAEKEIERYRAARWQRQAGENPAGEERDGLQNS